MSPSCSSERCSEQPTIHDASKSFQTGYWAELASDIQTLTDFGVYSTSEVKQGAR
ncbi:hypothetical protein SNOG_05751 [Parastagonospora nodorum SN15]|uniref:Uncharacterized protein n=1 Tax=Phaeosphaeria nodorum (strain SN15 / ATCC MYA-4574 / FGSC 10173) TaxID=321614 RepID=Q0UR63_PHANO|nr:hypothetical protein SNOG_05751 [Parastagonospora nodorum SN15]EAT86815.1 hypothetical protein SNOG_05751 [Parastagonospora nodorum SN15]